MTVNRIEALRQIIARPTTCEGERVAAQKALDATLSKREARQSAPRAGDSTRPSASRVEASDLSAFLHDLLRRADEANAKARRARASPFGHNSWPDQREHTSARFIDPSVFQRWADMQVKPAPPKPPAPAPDVDSLPRAQSHRGDPNVFRVQVDSEASMRSLFNASQPDYMVNLYGEARRVRRFSGHVCDHSRGATRWFMLFHYSDLAPKDNP